MARSSDDHLVVFEKLIDAELLANDRALQDSELFVELVPQFALPLKRQVSRADYQDALSQPAKLQVTQKQPGHDRLARARVVGEQESDSGQLEQMVVDRFELMRQWIDARDRKAEIRSNS